MPPDIVVIGASAGGVAALKKLVSQLSPPLNAALFVTIHLSPDRPSYLPEILSGAGPLPAHRPHDGETIRPGQIYVAPPDQHMLIEKDHIRLNRGAKVNRTRPAIDPLFRTAAATCKERVVGVVLTGALDDGAAGLEAIKAMGGITVVQDPEEAEFPDMPRSALNATDVDYCLPITGIAHLLSHLEEIEVKQRPSRNLPETVTAEAQFDFLGIANIETLNQIGKPSTYSCPDCHGVLWEVQGEALKRYRCQTGHAFTARSLLVSQVSDKENELWSILRSLEEIEKLSQQLASHERTPDPAIDVGNFKQIAQQTKEHIEKIRKMLMRKAPAPAANLRKTNDPEKSDPDR